MSVSRSIRDNLPDIPAAGAAPAIRDTTAALCLAPEISEAKRPATPDSVRKFRQSRYPQHRDLNVRYGVASTKDISAASLLQRVSDTPLQEFVMDQQESLYESRRRGPLGQTRPHNTLFPPKCGDKNFRFGIATVASESVKTIIYQHGAKFDDQKTVSEEHITKPVGRKYDWGAAGINPVTHRFGAVEPNTNGRGVASCLHFSECEPVTIVSQRVANARQAQHQPLGATKQAQHGAPADVVFGKKSVVGHWGTAQCIQGQYSEEEQQPDKDLGISMRRLKPEIHIPSQHTGRIFGAPTVRTDIPAPAYRSVADTTSYGDEMGCKHLLYPSEYAFDGVDQSDFEAERTPEELHKIFGMIGYVVPEDEYPQLCETAIRDHGKLSVESFRKTYNAAKFDI